MKILLISANTLTTPYPVYPIGLDHVAACIDARHRVRIEDLNALDGLNGLKHAIQEFDPDLMGLSLRNIDNTDTTDPMGFMGNYRAVVESVRQASPAPVVLGGSGFTLFPRQVLGELGADFGIVGEGERLNLLLEALELPGVIVPGGDEAAFPPPWAGTRRARPTQPPRHLAWYLRHGAMLNLQTKRGCPFRCIYCTYPLIEGRRLRCTPPMEVARTAKALEAAGARYLYITDSSFNADVDHSLDVNGVDAQAAADQLFVRIDFRRGHILKVQCLDNFFTQFIDKLIHGGSIHMGISFTGHFDSCTIRFQKTPY